MSDHSATVIRTRALITPEGVPLELRIPALSERLAAITYDTARIIAILIAVNLLRFLFFVFVPHGRTSDGVIAIISILFDFVLLNGYFIYYESKPGGATPGKRRAGIRVINKTGGPLRTEAVIARNLTRNFEILFPMILFAALANDHSESHVGMMAFAVGLLVLAMIPPLFTRDRSRVGDLLGGTLVVATPKAKLLQELGRPSRADFEHVFTREQLSMYGIFELQVLEDLLHTSSEIHRKQLATVAEKIAKKVTYEGAIAHPKQFLRDFYAAQRAHLERDLVLGKRKESKDG